MPSFDLKLLKNIFQINASFEISIAQRILKIVKQHNFWQTQKCLSNQQIRMTRMTGVMMLKIQRNKFNFTIY